MTSFILHEKKGPDVRELLGRLEGDQVQYVIVGSVGAQLYGVELEPADLDIVPSTAPSNLKRLIRVLDRIEAHPPGPFGSWTILANGEHRWVEHPTTAEEIAAWRPDAADVSTLDHLFRTRYGDLDVVPAISGSYDVLMSKAVRLPAYGYTPWVGHIDEILARMTVPRREKDVPRVMALRRLQRESAARRDLQLPGP
jgi:hypothetical protein